MSEVSRKVTPVWMAWWMREIMSCSGFGGPYKADMPMHPKPCADTSSPCEPSFILPIPAEAIFLQQPLSVLAAEWMDECVSSLCLLYLNSSIHNHPGWIWVALFIYFLNFAAIVELLPCVSTYESSSNKINKNKSHRWPFHVKNEDIKKEFCCAISSSHFI